MARVCEDRKVLGIDRANERACQAAAASIGIAPAIVYHEEGVLVSEFVEGRTLEDPDVKEDETLERLALLLRGLHESRSELRGELLYFCPFQTIRTYVGNAKELGAVLPDQLDAILEDLDGLSEALAPVSYTHLRAHET